MSKQEQKRKQKQHETKLLFRIISNNNVVDMNSFFRFKGFYVLIVHVHPSELASFGIFYHENKVSIKPIKVM